MAKSDQKPLLKNPRKIVFLGVPLLFLVGIAIPMAMGDGSARFKDAEALVATEAVRAVRDNHRGIDGLDTIGVISYHAESIKLLKSGIDPLQCQRAITGSYETPSSEYTVNVSYRTYFGIQLQTDPVIVCYSFWP